MSEGRRTNGENEERGGDWITPPSRTHLLGLFAAAWKLLNLDFGRLKFLSWFFFSSPLDDGSSSGLTCFCSPLPPPSSHVVLSVCTFSTEVLWWSVNFYFFFLHIFVYVLYHCYFYYCIIVINDIVMIIFKSLGSNFCCFYGHIVMMKTAFLCAHKSEIICCVNTHAHTHRPLQVRYYHYGTDSDWPLFFVFFSF